jgi:WD40 repeat protein
MRQHRRWSRGHSRRAFLMRCGLGMLSWSALRTRRAAAAEAWESSVIQLYARAPGQPRPIALTIAIRPSGQRLAVAGDDHVIQIWDLREQRIVNRLTGHTGIVRTVGYSPDGRLLASAGHDGRILFWDEALSRPVNELAQVSTAITRLVFSHDNQLLATTGFEEPLRLFDVRSATQVEALPSPCRDMRALAFAPRRAWLAVGGADGKIRLWDATAATLRRQWNAHQRRIRDLEFSPDGRYLASCGEDRVVRISTVDDDGWFELPQQNAKAMALAFIGNEQIAVGGSDNMIRVWNLAERREGEPLQGHTGSVTAIQYADDALISASYDTTVRIWRTNPHVAQGRSKARDVTR